MNEEEISFRNALAASPGEWSIRLSVVKRVLERDATNEAVAILLDAPAAPSTEEMLRRVIEVAGVNSAPVIDAFIAENESNPIGYHFASQVCEAMGDNERAAEYAAAAEQLSAEPMDPSNTPDAEAKPSEEPTLGALPDNLLPTIVDAPPPPDLNPIDSSPSPWVATKTEPEPVALEQPRKRRKGRMTAIVVAIGVHVLIAVIAALVVVLPSSRDEPEIVAAIAAPSIQKKEMQKKNVVKQSKKTSAAAAAAPMAQLMRANAMAKIAMPTVTKVSTGPLGIGEADFGGGGLGSGSGGAGNSGASFFGGSSSGERFLFILDHSRSMNRNQVELRNVELKKALDSIKGSKYHVLLFAGGAVHASRKWSVIDGGKRNIFEGPGRKRYEFKSVGGAQDFEFEGSDSDLPKEEWRVATSAAIHETMKFAEDTSLIFGTDWEMAFEVAYQMNPSPDVIFFMADGTGGNNTSRILSMNRRAGSPTINTVAMQTTAGSDEFAELAKRTRGAYTIVDRSGKPIDGFDYIANPEKYQGRL